MATQDSPNSRPISRGPIICILIHVWILIACCVAVPSCIGLGIYSELHYKTPDLPKFMIESATVSQLNTDGSSLTATWDITLLAVNPNRKHKLHIDLVKAARVRYYVDDAIIELGSTPTLPSHLALKEMHKKRFGFTVGAERRLWIGDAVAQQISNDRVRGSVKFGVTMDAVVRSKAESELEEEHGVKVTCDQVAFVFSGNNGTGVLTSQPWCCVDRWKAYAVDPLKPWRAYKAYE